MDLSVFEQMAARGHETVLFCRDRQAGYRGLIAIHSTALGPAVGGTRLWHYATEAEALDDVLRLSRGMTYTNAAAGRPFGGGKAVILAGEELPAGEARERLLVAHGRAVDRLGGRFITGEDVGISVADMAIVRRATAHVAGLATGAGDPSPYTARGVVAAIEACASRRWGTRALAGRTVAVQGCGHVGSKVARRLADLGAAVVISDVEEGRVADLARTIGARVVAPGEIYDVEADIFAPCALGGILNADTIARLKASIVAGAANNQLRTPEDGDRLARRNILYAPDYMANAGGVISGAIDLAGWTREQALARIDGIFDTMLGVFERAAADDVAPHEAADRLAEARLGPDS